MQNKQEFDFETANYPQKSPLSEGFLIILFYKHPLFYQ